MILQELVRYYDRQRALPHSDIAPLGWIRRPIDYVIVLEEDGNPLDLQPQYTVEKGKRVGPAALLPSIGKQARKHTNSGKDANLLWDNASFVLGLGDRGPMKLRSFAETLDTWFAELKDAGLAAVKAFLASIQANPDVARNLIARAGVKEDFEQRDPILVFRAASDGVFKVHEREAIRHAYELKTNAARIDGRRGRCLVTGATDVPLARNETVIKGVFGAQPAGANLVSFNAPAFVSYGKQGRQAESAPISVDASTAYSTSLNVLLESGRNRVQVGDASTVFWADRPSRFDGESSLADFFSDDPDRSVRAVQALFGALKTGQLPVAERDVCFFVLGLAPNRGRINVRFWLRAPLADLAPRIAQHFHDIEIVRRYDSDPITPPLSLLLKSIALRDDTKNVPPRLAGEWTRAILENTVLPATQLNAAVARCRSEQAARDKNGNRRDNVPYLRAAAMKAWVNRWSRANQRNEKEIAVALDPENTNPAYRLGRLFAAYERIQCDAADRELNRTIREAYFGAAMATPASVFPRLVKLSQHHLRDLRRNKPGLHTLRESLLLEIASGIDATSSFPRTQVLPEQGRFALGYYHQRQAFFTRKDAQPNATPQGE